MGPFAVFIISTSVNRSLMNGLYFLFFFCPFPYYSTNMNRSKMNGLYSLVCPFMANHLHFFPLATSNGNFRSRFSLVKSVDQSAAWLVNWSIGPSVGRLVSQFVGQLDKCSGSGLVSWTNY